LTSCAHGRTGSGFQPRSFYFAAGSRSHRGFFTVTWTFRISAKIYYKKMLYLHFRAYH
jgi:hypothetical protein